MTRASRLQNENSEKKKRHSEPSRWKPKKKRLKYFTDEMRDWLKVRLTMWLQNYATWQTYYVGKRVREENKPYPDSPEHAFYLMDAGQM